MHILATSELTSGKSLPPVPVFSSVCELDPCGKQFGPADKIGCRTGKLTVPETKPVEVPVTPQATEVPTAAPTQPPEPRDKFVCPPGWTELDGFCYL